MWGPYNLTEDYRVIADNLSYTLQRKKVIEQGKRVGEVDWTAIGYYGSVHHLVEQLLSLQIAENLGDLGKAFERIQEVQNNLKELVKIKCEREKSWIS